MANRLNKQSPQLRLKDSIKKEMYRINKDTLPLHCYAEVPKLLKKTIRYSCSYKDNFSIEDITKFQNDKNYKTNETDIESYEEYINSLTDEQNVIYHYNDYYNLSNEEIYEKRFCSDLEKLPKEVEKCINYLSLSLSWYNNEIEKLNAQETPSNKDKKNLNKLVKSIQQYSNTINKYSAFWNKSVTDLIFLYNEYSKEFPLESIIHNLVVLSSLIKKQDMQARMDKIITNLYKKHLEMLNLNILKALFSCSLTVKLLIIQEIGETREFVMEKIIPNNKLKQMFFAPSDDNH